MGLSSVKSALITVVLIYCFVTLVLAIITGVIENISLSVAFGIMACVAALGGILIVRFYKEDTPKDNKPTDEINNVETQKFLEENKQ